MIPGSIDCGTCTGELSLNAVSLHQPNWCVLSDLTPLWLPADVRGDQNVVIPGAQGTRPYDPVIHQAVHDLSFVVSGVVDDDGVEIAGAAARRAALTASIDFLMSTCFDPEVSASADLVKPAGGAVAGDVQALLKPGKRTGPIQVFTIHLTIPHGLLV